MPTVENFALCSYDIYFSAIENVQFLPGINLVSDTLLEKLKSNEAYKRFIELGIFQEQLLKEPEGKIDDRTNLLVVEKKGETVPLHETSVNKTVSAGPKGKQFKIEDCKNIPTSISTQIALQPPTGGWIDASHVIDALQIQDPKIQQSIKDMF